MSTINAAPLVAQTIEFGSPPVVLQFRPLLDMNADQFAEFAGQNPELKLELTTKGDVIMMSPTGGETGDFNGEITMQLRLWSKQNGTGKTFDSSTMFKLPNNALRSPDASWVSLQRWNQLSKKERQTFAPLCPDFVVELRSPSDRLIDLQAKLEEYLANGAQLGWIIDPINKSVHIYRPNQPCEILAESASVSGENVLPGFELVLAEIFTTN